MENLVIPAQRYLGIPWKAHGRTREGVDCWGCLMLFFKEELRIMLPEFAYSVETNAERAAEIYAHMAEHVEEILGPPSPGDILLMKYQGSVSHIGVYVGCGYVLHAPQEGVCLSSLTGMEHGRTLQSRIAGYYRYKGH